MQVFRRSSPISPDASKMRFQNVQYTHHLVKTKSVLGNQNPFENVSNSLFSNFMPKLFDIVYFANNYH